MFARSANGSRSTDGKGADLVTEVEAARAEELAFLPGYQGKERHAELRQVAELMDTLASRVNRIRRKLGR